MADKEDDSDDRIAVVAENDKNDEEDDNDEEDKEKEDDEEYDKEANTKEAFASSPGTNSHANFFLEAVVARSGTGKLRSREARIYIRS